MASESEGTSSSVEPDHHTFSVTVSGVHMDANLHSRISRAVRLAALLEVRQIPAGTEERFGVDSNCGGCAVGAV